MWRTHDAMGWWMLFSAGLWIMFWVFLVGALTSLFGPRDRPRGGTATDDADRLAARRYADGEIDRQEYDEIRRRLDHAASRS